MAARSCDLWSAVIARRCTSASHKNVDPSSMSILTLDPIGMSEQCRPLFFVSDTIA